MPKPSAKEDMIAETLRERIISGVLRPGVQLSTYEVLEREFDASRMTMNKAISRLKDDGFLTGIERRGVFVSERPPHMNRIALLLAWPGRLNHFAACLESSAHDFAERSGRDIEIFSNLNSPYFDQAEATRLKEELAARRFAGMLIAFDPAGCPDKGVFEFPLPKVYLAPGQRRDGVKLSMDGQGFVRRGLERLHALGARRIAILAYPHANPSIELAARLLGEFGLSSKPEWQIAMDNPDIAEQIIKLLLSADKDKRPDGLLLTDDHLAEPVARGIVASRVKVPDELKALSHCNWAMPPPRPFPMELLGFDSAMVVSLSVDYIDATNRGVPCTGKLLVPSLFENEMQETRDREMASAQGRSA